MWGPHATGKAAPQGLEQAGDVETRREWRCQCKPEAAVTAEKTLAPELGWLAISPSFLQPHGVVLSKAISSSIR